MSVVRWFVCVLASLLVCGFVCVFVVVGFLGCVYVRSFLGMFTACLLALLWVRVYMCSGVNVCFLVLCLLA